MTGDDQLTRAERIRLEALVLAVKYTSSTGIYDGNSLMDGTVLVAKRYTKWIEEAK